jgi:hypothetical protein
VAVRPGILAPVKQMGHRWACAVPSCTATFDTLQGRNNHQRLTTAPAHRAALAALDAGRVNTNQRAWWNITAGGVSVFARDTVSRVAAVPVATPLTAAQLAAAAAAARRRPGNHGVQSRVSYTFRAKYAALKELRARGNNFLRTSQDTGIPASNLKRWHKQRTCVPQWQWGWAVGLGSGVASAVLHAPSAAHPALLCHACAGVLHLYLCRRHDHHHGSEGPPPTAHCAWRTVREHGGARVRVVQEAAGCAAPCQCQHDA